MQSPLLTRVCSCSQLSVESPTPRRYACHSKPCAAGPGSRVSLPAKAARAAALGGDCDITPKRQPARRESEVLFGGLMARSRCRTGWELWRGVQWQFIFLPGCHVRRNKPHFLQLSSRISALKGAKQAALKATGAAVRHGVRVINASTGTEKDLDDCAKKALK
ncbi:hypothetical protein SKAU_G00402250 [Synaphobranchus kaupii]|uniref:Uncharacterized protein n=1 Tax=Synaphobranchus kaupii TaxID=118154 RepID=A0A9Q1E9A1_SYNKA|nr:hypothetical protein SKAU_G00402250 [Synaphobranchus kaupii]